MQVRLYANMSDHQRQAMLEMQTGLAAHGVDARIFPPESYEPSAVACTWGVRYDHIVDGQAQHSGRLVVVECGYFGDRMENVSVGIDGLNGRAQFGNDNSPPDRWMVNGVDLKPWRTGGEYIVVMGQCAGDASLCGIDFAAWAKGVAGGLENRRGDYLPIFYRKHPLSGGVIPGIRTLQGSMSDALDKAAMVVTFNSNSGVDAVLAGVPTVSIDRGSMVWPVSAHSVFDEPVTPDRTQWSHNLAYCQWSRDELMSGAAWAHITPVLDIPMPRELLNGAVNA